ncbi:DUF4252 domain-containing protein [Chryseobacterium sp. POL2]|uniref:DUF4252 domain-containing protein n=1 Tax=Chryseobacterium sp. POL2 TaxID=2713414 RepID=UPI0013E1C822|nr:DUF4252 domain-containing protein [Chryseobacterium sp. POL2]QIG90378.1 DUF4252 domain-containing protein [Chryseobacterium sp. POL2]
MKKYIFLGFSILTMQSCLVSQKPSVDFFNTPYYRNQANFMSINVPTFLAKSFLKNQLKEDGESEEVINLVKKVSKIKLMTSENMDSKMMAEFTNYLNQEKFEEWASIRNDGDVININAQQSDDVIKKIMIVVNSKDNDAVFIDVSGTFTIDDISKLVEAGKTSNIKINRKKS